MHWFVRDAMNASVRVCGLGWGLENMNAFLEMSRRSRLRQILEELEDYQGGTYHACPGEYLELSVEDGCVTAQITLCDALPCRMTVGFFRRLVTEYLAEWDIMIRERGLG